MINRARFLAFVSMLVAAPRALAATTSISALVPASGEVGDTVRIQGRGLGATSSVKFNGVVASFHVVGAQAVDAVVPSAASTGFVKVVSGSRTATSPYPFEVVTPPPPQGLRTSGALEG